MTLEHINPVSQWSSGWRRCLLSMEVGSSISQLRDPLQSKALVSDLITVRFVQPDTYERHQSSKRWKVCYLRSGAAPTPSMLNHLWRFSPIMICKRSLSTLQGKTWPNSRQNSFIRRNRQPERPFSMQKEYHFDQLTQCCKADLIISAFLKMRCKNHKCPGLITTTKSQRLKFWLKRPTGNSVSMTLS
ncbi:uncharacterized protein UDID_17423 [Ustilago sp. UG-2017a]|nr:uncharacterized protein UDID_17423 [Ustilago sp. UG-2017a]